MNDNEQTRDSALEAPLLALDMRHMDVLPDARARDHKRNQVQGPDGKLWTPIYCVNCGKAQGGVYGMLSHVFWICDDCYARHGVPPGVAVIPDEVFWAKMQAAMIERHGHVLTEPEILVELDNPSSYLHKLTQDAPKTE